MRYSTVLFDADQTLLDFHKSEDEAIRETMSLFGINPSNENVNLYSQINLSLWKALERGEIEKSVLVYRRFELLLEALGVEGDAKQMAQTYVESLSRKGYLLNGAKEMCEYLYGKVKMYIVTNGLEAVQRSRYSICGIEKYFDGIFISGEIGYEKPSIKFFEYATDHIKEFDKKNTLIVGDSLSSDMKGGIDFGIDTCWYAPDTDATTDMGVTYVARSFDDVIKYIIGEERV